MSNRMLSLLLAVIALLAVPALALADDWVAVKLRGVVFQLVDGEWVRLQRGDIVPDDRIIRTLASGRVDLQRDAEVITLAGNTQVQILDRVDRRFTTVKQYFGTVEVEAEVQNVQHFAVETPFLAAVVKGTHFIVKSGKSGASVNVTRGKVEVSAESDGATVFVLAGQKAVVPEDLRITVTGKGIRGKLKAGEAKAAAKAENKADAGERTNNAGGNGNGNAGGNGNGNAGGNGNGNAGGNGKGNDA